MVRLAQDVFVLDEHRLVAITPPRLPGLVDVQLHHPDTGQSAVLEAGYLFFNPVTIIEVDPPTGHVLGGEPITIIGSGFVPGTNLLIGGRAAIQVQVVDDSTIKFEVFPGKGESEVVGFSDGARIYKR